MTIASTPRRAGPFATNGVQTTFAFAFKVFNAEDVQVTLSTSTVPLVYGTDYTVTLNPDQDASPGGIVTIAPARNGPTVSVTSNAAYEQPALFTNQGGFYPRVLNDSLDRQTIFAQQLDERMDRAVILPPGSEGITLPTTGTTNTVLGYDANDEFGLLPSGLFKGDPGGNIMAVGLFGAIALMTVPAQTDVIQTAGFHTLGKGIARYKRWSAPMTPLPAWGENVWWTTDVGGARWMLAEEYPTSDMFGTYGDAARAYLSQTVTGTDVTAAINKLTYYAQSEWGNGTAILSKGGHRTSDTIHVGTGDTFRSVRLIGEVENPWATRHDNQQSFPSAEIKAERNDRPAINVQGARSNAIKHISIEGPLYAHALNTGLGRSDGGETINDVLASSWLPASALHKAGQYNSGCGIAVDAFSGTDPSVTYGAGQGYPVVAYTEATTQYGKVFSSEVTMEGVKISGFTIGLALQPGDADGNGDFVRMNYCSTTECIYGISVGNSQSRNVEISNHNYIHVHTFITNKKHGKQRGKLGGPLINISGGQSVQLFDLSMGFAGDVNFINHYSEGLWRFGDATGQGRIVHNGDVTMTSTAATGMFAYRGVPANIFGTSAHPSVSGAATETEIELSGALVLPSVGLLSSRSVIARGLNVSTRERSGGTSITAPMAQAHNAMCGGLFVSVTPYGRRVARLATTHFLFNVTTGAPISRATWDGVTWEKSRRVQGCPIEAKNLAAVQSPTRVPIPREYSTIDHASMTSKTLTGTTFTFTMAGIAASVDRRHLVVGDVIWHEPTDSLFVITARATDDFTCTLLNNHLNTDGTITHPQGTPNLAQGTYYPMSGRYYVPDYPVFGDFTSGNATIAGVGTGEGFYGVEADFADGDSLAVNGMEEHTIGTGRVISSHNAAAFTISMNSSAIGTEANRRLVFRRIP